MVWLRHLKIWECILLVSIIILSRKYKISKPLLNSLDLLSWSTLITTHLASASDVFTTRNFCPPLPPPSWDISLDLFPTVYQCLMILLHLSTPHQEITSLGKLISWPWRLMPGWRSCKVLTQLWRPLSTLLLQLCTAAKGRGHLWSLIPPKLQ